MNTAPLALVIILSLGLPCKAAGPVKIAATGAFPVQGAYGEWEYLNWAAKFMIDSNLLEQDIDGRA